MSLPFADALFWAAVAVCAVAQAALLRSFFLGPSRPPREATAGFRATETLWAVVPALVLVLLFVGTWRTMHGPVVMRWDPAAASAEVRP